MSDHTRKIEALLHDTSIGIWQDNANDPTFKDEIFGGVISHLRARGWCVSECRKTAKNYPSIRQFHKRGQKGALCVKIDVSGRTCSLEFWSEQARQHNRNGREFDFDKLDRMPYLDRLRFWVERREILRWLGTVSAYTVAEPTRAASKKLPALDRIARSYAESWHSDKTLGRPVCNSEYNARSADGGLIAHGAPVWYRGRDGRWRRGVAYYNLNSMWFVVESPHTLLNMTCSDLFLRSPENLRGKCNAKLRRQRLERELSRAVMASDYARAQELQRILFADEKPYRIWSRKNDAYYGPIYQGYTSCAVSAGRYTRAEAEAECRRVPHILSMVAPCGKKVRFDA